jgi:opacity protein-like surface antigen
MKKIALLLTFVAFVVDTTNAQNFRFGLQASPSFSWFSTNDKFLENSGSNLGIKLGMLGEKYFQDNYAFFSGIGFGFNAGGELQSGYANYRPWTGSDLSIMLDETDDKSLPANSKLRYHLTYVEVPFGLKMRGGTNENSNLKFYAEAPVITLGFLTKSIGDIRGAGSFDTVDENIRDDVNGLALSWGLGAGIEYEVATHTTLVAGLSYQNQFTDVTDKARARRTTADGWVDEKAKTTPRILSIRLGVYF